MKIKQNVAISESGFVFNPISGESFTVNPVGIEIINYLKEGKSAEEITGLILEEFNVEENTFEKDYQDFTGLLNAYGLIEKTNEEKN
ncbi:MAG: PqqD family protein [Bacteroidales bacterium]|nr:PqqD family protein [Bacteroidales bacterium]